MKNFIIFYHSNISYNLNANISFKILTLFRSNYQVYLYVLIKKISLLACLSVENKFSPCCTILMFRLIKISSIKEEKLKKNKKTMMN